MRLIARHTIHIPHPQPEHGGHQLVVSPGQEIDVADVFAAELLRDGHAIIPASPAPAPLAPAQLGESGPAHTNDTTDEAA